MCPSTLCRMGAAALIACLVGCAPSRVALKPSFWKESQHKIGVATLAPPRMATYRAGGQGALDIGISAAMASELEKHLQTLDAGRFETVADHFVAQFNKRGISAQRLSQPVDPLSFKLFAATSSGAFAERDLRPLAQREGIDMLILLSLQQCGTLRPYYGFIPLNRPKAFCVGKGELIDLKSNEVKWRAFPEEDAATVAILGEWDQPPDFRNVSTAINQAVTEAQVFVFKAFFGRPVPAVLADRPRTPLASRPLATPPPVSATVPSSPAH